MADIKIRRVVKGSVKTLDRVKTLGERMRGATIRTKDKAENSVTTHESSTEEYAANKVESAVSKGAREGAQQFDSQGKKAVRDTKENVEFLRYRIKNRTAKKKANPKAKDATKTSKKTKSSAKAAKRSTHRAGSTADTMNKTAKTAKSAPKTASRTEKGTVKTSKYTVKVSRKSIKTAAKTGKTAIKTAENTAKATKAAAKASAKAAKAARVAVKATIKGIKVAVKAAVAAVKAIIAAVKGLVSAIIAGGWIAVVIIIIIALIALIVGSCFGIFFSNEDTGSEYSMQSVIAELDEEFNIQIENTISTHPHDVLERSGATAAWEEVLSVYSVKTTTDPDDAAEVASIDDGKKAIIREVFWLMNTINARTESRTETVIVETVDRYGNVVTTEVNVTKVYLIITVTHKTADEMADHYGFSEDQREQLAELLSEENRSMWDAVLSGVL